MLTRLVLSGFRSFNEKTIFDFTATNYQMLSESNVNNSILKGSLFMGPNASGKTNAISAIALLLDLMFKDNILDLPRNLCFFSKDNMKLEYDFQFDNDIINFSFEIDKSASIVKETLLLNGKEHLKRIGNSVETDLSETKYRDNLDPKTLFLRMLYFNTKFAGNEVLLRWAKYMSDSVYFNADRKLALPYDINNKLNLIKYLEEYGTKELNAFFDYFGFNQMVDYGKEHKLTQYAQATSDNKNIYLKRNNTDYWMPLELESLGNQTLLNMLPALLHAVSHDCMFIIDEFSSAFHNELEELIVRYFMSKSKASQMFFVSHSTNLLKSTLIRPDQVYIIDFKNVKGSDIKRISSEHPRESQNFEKMYLAGIFGGLPNYKGE